jgi:hypothetical protein
MKQKGRNPVMLTCPQAKIVLKLSKVRKEHGTDPPSQLSERNNPDNPSDF